MPIKKTYYSHTLRAFGYHEMQMMPNRLVYRQQLIRIILFEINK